MLRISHYVALAVGAVAVCAQASLAQAHSAHAYRGSDRHYRHHVAFLHRARNAEVTSLQNAEGFPPFGYGAGYSDQYAGARMGRRERQYFASAQAQPFGFGQDQRSQLAGLVEQQASANGVPASLVHRVIMRESGYNPRAVNSGNYGLMQIRLGTARAMGYSGSAAGLLDAETNMTYAVRYLAGAYRAAGGNEARAVALYARGYNAPRLQEASYQESSYMSAPSTESFFAPAAASARPPRWFGYVRSADSRSTGYRLRHYHHPV
jgi:soluble lytic murein transglycosylase-like protein